MAEGAEESPADSLRRLWSHPDEQLLDRGDDHPDRRTLADRGERNRRLVRLRSLGPAEVARSVKRRFDSLLRYRSPSVAGIRSRLVRTRWRGRHRLTGSTADRQTFNAIGFQTRDDGKVLDSTDLLASRSRPERLVRRVHRAKAVRFVELRPDTPTMLELGLAGAPLVDAVCPPDSNNELTRLASAPLAVLSDARERELHSIRVRRAARRLSGPDVTARTVSVVLATQRPEFLEHTLLGLEAQTTPRHQVLIGMHGPAWETSHVESAVQRIGGAATVERFDADIPFGEVLQRLSEQATGELLTKWDDDDWYGPHHLEDLIGALDDSGADLVGKAAEFVRLESTDLTMRRFASGGERYGTTLAGGTLLLRVATLCDVGGWAPVPRHVDRRLIGSVVDAGGVIYRTHGFEYLLRRTASGHTWTADDRYFLQHASDVRAGLDLAFCGFDE